VPGIATKLRRAGVDDFKLRRRPAQRGLLRNLRFDQRFLRLCRAGTDTSTKPRGPFAGMRAKSAGNVLVANVQGPSDWERRTSVPR